MITRGISNVEVVGQRVMAANTACGKIGTRTQAHLELEASGEAAEAHQSFVGR